MSAWTMYWIMQATTISQALGVAGGFTLLALVFFTIVSLVQFDSQDEDERKKGHVMWAIVRRFAWAPIVLIVAHTFMPTTKSLCAIIAVPMIVNDETLQADAAEIYRLGMAKLKDELADQQEGTE